MNKYRIESVTCDAPSSVWTIKQSVVVAAMAAFSHFLVSTSRRWIIKRSHSRKEGVPITGAPEELPAAPTLSMFLKIAGTTYAALMAIQEFLDSTSYVPDDITLKVRVGDTGTKEIKLGKIKVGETLNIPEEDQIIECNGSLEIQFYENDLLIDDNLASIIVEYGSHNQGEMITSAFDERGSGNGWYRVRVSFL